MSQYMAGLVCLLIVFVVMMILGFIYQSAIPEHFEELYQNRFVDDRWNRLFGVMTYEEVQTKVDSNILLVVVGCSVTVDALVRLTNAYLVSQRYGGRSAMRLQHHTNAAILQILAIMGQVWLGQNNKEDMLLADFHSGDEPMVEQIAAIELASQAEAELINSLKERARIQALVNGATANPLVGDGV